MAPHFNVSQRYSRILMAFYMLVEGFTGSVLYYGSLPWFFYYLKVSMIDYQKALVIAMVMWSARAGMGALSDAVPIFGAHKRWYATGAAVLLPCFLFGVVFGNKYKTAVVMFATVATMLMIVATMFEGEYAAKIRFEGATNGLAAFTKGLVMFGSVGGLLVVGALADSEEDAYRMQYGFAMCIPMALPLIYYLFKHPHEVFSNDAAVSDDAKRELLNVDRESARHVVRFTPNRSECTLAGAIVASAFMILAVMFNIGPGNIYTSFAVAGALSMTVVAYATWVYRDTPVLCGLCQYSFAHEVFYVDITAAMDVFYTAPSICLIGPDFDLMWYIGWTKIIGHTIAVVVILCYMRWFQGWRCRTSVIVGITFRIYSSLTDIVIGKRWNASVGFSDKSVYLLGDAMVSPAASTFVQLALILATTRALIKGKETFTQSVVASLQAMGQSMSRIAGIALIHTMSVKADLSTGQCNYDNYVPLLIFAHIICPSVLYPLAFIVLK